MAFHTRSSAKIFGQFQLGSKTLRARDRIALVERQPDGIEQRIDAEDQHHRRRPAASQGKGCSEVSQRGSQGLRVAAGM